jgi:hypothetical protein
MRSKHPARSSSRRRSRSTTGRASARRHDETYRGGYFDYRGWTPLLRATHFRPSVGSLMTVDGRTAHRRERDRQVWTPHAPLAGRHTFPAKSVSDVSAADGLHVVRERHDSNVGSDL